MQSNIESCQKCRRFFNYIGGDKLCPACKEEMEKEFQKVKEFIREHKGCNMVEVAELCEVSEKQIKEWIRQERLILTEPMGDITCEKCGAPILSGRFCAKCRAEMVGELNSAFKKEASAPAPAKPESDHKDRMRFLK